MVECSSLKGKSKMYKMQDRAVAVDNNKIGWRSFSLSSTWLAEQPVGKEESN